MQIVRSVPLLRSCVADLRMSGRPIALVPTMGALHAGHMALIEAAKARGATAVASIFVNPKQFGPNEDLARYPRQEQVDAAMLEEAGCALLWAPEVAAMYPDGFATTVSVSGVSEGLDGAARPGHFDGVATVVLKLFNQVRPDLALFGEKDFQQLAVIRRMAADLDLGIEIVGVPTVRETDGLALSSRNAYLSADERKRALAMPRSLAEAAERIARGHDVTVTLDDAKDRLACAGFDPVDYVALVDADTLAEMQTLARPARLLAAARIGPTRLIDNVGVNPVAKTFRSP